MSSSLREKFRQDLVLAGFSEKTVQIYLKEAVKFASHHGQCPSRITEEEIRKYLYGLVVLKKVSDSYFRQSYSAIKFLYTKTLRQPWGLFDIVRPRKRFRVPVILSIEEVRKILCCVKFSYFGITAWQEANNKWQEKDINMQYTFHRL